MYGQLGGSAAGGGVLAVTGFAVSGYVLACVILLASGLLLLRLGMRRRPVGRHARVQGS
jgi:hypothetical protein